MQGNHISRLLEIWYPRKDQCKWVLGSVYKVQGSSYRKPGAMMLFSSDGQQYGLLSGGCLESDIQNHAKKVMVSGKSLTLCYDSNDEDDIVFQLGIGCGGTVHILLQPIAANNNYLSLVEASIQLSKGRAGWLWQAIPNADGKVEVRWQLKDIGRAEVVDNSAATTLDRIAEAPVLPFHNNHSACLTQEDDQAWLVTPFRTRTHLLVVGGGIDARHVVAMAKNLDWKVTLWDSRPANARREHFLSADMLLHGQLEKSLDKEFITTFDAAIVMTHNLNMDAEAVGLLQNSAIEYLALLGPKKRKSEVLALADLTEDTLRIPVDGPAGLDLGAELPEGIALSILAQCYAVLHRGRNCI